MHWNDHRRRAVTVVLVVLALLAVPAVANAEFSSARTSGLAASTGTLATPSGISGTFRCSSSSGTEAVTVTVTSFTDAGPSTAYGFGLLIGTTVKASEASSTRSATLTVSQANDEQITTWTLAIQGQLARWTSGIATATIVCPANATRHGTL